MLGETTAPESENYSSEQIAQAISACVVSMDGRKSFVNDEENPLPIMKKSKHFNHVIGLEGLQIIQTEI